MEVETEQPGYSRYKANDRAYAGVIAQLTRHQVSNLTNLFLRKPKLYALPVKHVEDGLIIGNDTRSTGITLHLIHLHARRRKNVGIPFA